MTNEDRSQISDGYHTFDELYQHRHALFLNLMRQNRHMAWASKVHSDGTSFDGWFIAGIETPAGQISYHLPDVLWAVVEDMGVTVDKPPPWDGHTAEDVCLRLMEMASWQ